MGKTMIEQASLEGPQEAKPGELIAALTPILVDEQTAAALLGMSVRYLWTLFAEGVIPRRKQGRSVRYLVSDLKAYAEKLPLAELPNGGADAL